MKTISYSLFKKELAGFITMLFLGLVTSWGMSTSPIEGKDYYSYKGKVVNAVTGDAIAGAYLTLNESTITTITNNEGEFSLKVPIALANTTVTTSSIGFESKTIHLNYFKKKNTYIELNEATEKLSAIEVFGNYQDARSLVKKVLENRGQHYVNEPSLMTAFYRESIKKRNRNVQLSEAVVKIHKQPYTSAKRDLVAVYKARKSTDYDKLDTLALQLRGGPYNPLFLDIMKYPDFLFSNEYIDNYEFSYGESTSINNQHTLVVKFQEKGTTTPYYGHLFIDAKTKTLVKAYYKLNVKNNKLAEDLLVQKKPGSVKVTPTDVSYKLDYIQKNGKWYYSYGNASLELTINWKHKLFNSHYSVNSEMLVTDWQKEEAKKINKKSDGYLSPAIILADNIQGFADTNFWGDNNIIEPNKSIQNAIQKIQRNIAK